MEQMTPATGQQAIPDRSLQATLEKFNEAFNRLDAKAVSSFWAESGTLLTPVGTLGDGRDGVERAFREDAETILEGTTSRFTIARARPIGSDCVLLDLDHEVRNARMQDGSTGTMRLHVMILAQKSGEGWQWLDARPYAFMQRPPRVH